MSIEERFDDQVRLLRERIDDAFSSFQKDLYKDDSDVVAIGIVHDKGCSYFEEFKSCTCGNGKKVELTLNNDGLLVEKGD